MRRDDVAPESYSKFPPDLRSKRTELQAANMMEKLHQEYLEGALLRGQRPSQSYPKIPTDLKG